MTDFVRVALRHYGRFLNYLAEREHREVKERIGTRLILEHIGEVLDGGLLIARLPTGYGKSIVSMPLATAVKEVGWEYGLSHVIHVLPLRSLVQDLVGKAIDAVMSGKLEPLDYKDVSYQASLHLGVYKDVLFQKTLVYTTFDSFILNFTKITPLRTRYASFELARTSIYTSIVIFDEAHLFAEIDERRAFTSMITSIKGLLELGVPVVILTATIPDALIERLRHEINPRKMIVLTMDNSANGVKIEERPGFKHVVFNDNSWRGFDIKTQFIRPNEIFDKIRELMGDRDKKPILIVRNTVIDAIETYRKLIDRLNVKRDKIVLIHGRLTKGDRINVLDKVKGGNVEIIVATQVIEAGVDMSAKTLITDAAPLAQLVQRAGRVARWCVDRGDCKGEVYIIDEVKGGVYDDKIVKESINAIKAVSNGDKCRGIDWRVPDSQSRNSYFRLLNEVYGRSGYYDRLSLEVEVYRAIDDIDKFVTIHRNDVRRLLRSFCNFARNAMAIPVIINDELSKKIQELRHEFEEEVRDVRAYIDDLERHIVDLDLEYLNARDRWKEVILHEERRLYTLVMLRLGDKNVVKAIDVDVLDQNGKWIACRKILELDKLIARRVRELLGPIEDFEDVHVYQNVIGFIAKPGAYEVGVGLKVDQP